MSKYVDEAKKRLEEEGVGAKALTATINLYINPDSEQKLAEEIFRLREENEILSDEKDEFKEAALGFVAEVKTFLIEIASMNYDNCNFKKDFNKLQKRAKETYRILDLMEMLHE